MARGYLGILNAFFLIITINYFMRFSIFHRCSFSNRDNNQIFQSQGSRLKLQAMEMYEEANHIKIIVSYVNM